MKTINANVATNFGNALNLASRRCYPSMDTAAIKRDERRRARRALRKELGEVNFEGVRNEIGMISVPVAKPVAGMPVIQFLRPETDDNTVFTTVTVFRKRDRFSRTTVEQLQIAA